MNIRECDEKLLRVLEKKLKTKKLWFDSFSRGFWPNDEEWLKLDPHPSIVGKECGPMTADMLLGYMDSFKWLNESIDKLKTILINRDQ